MHFFGGSNWWQDIVQIPQNEIGFLPTIPIVSYYFLCVIWSPWIHFLALPIPDFIDIASLLGGMYILTHPNPTPSSVDNFKTCPVPWSLFWFSPFSLSAHSLPHCWSPSSLKSHNFLSLPPLCHLCLSYIYFLPFFYSLHFKFLDNKICLLSYCLHNEEQQIWKLKNIYFMIKNLSGKYKRIIAVMLQEFSS